MPKMTSPLSEAVKQILYIEQNKDCRVVLTYVLGHFGYEVTTAITVAEGLSLARRERFDAFILSGRYSDGDGVELCRQIRAFDPHTPILFYSSAAHRDDIGAGMAAGVQQYLTKPTGIDIIEQAVSRLLAGTPATQAHIQ
jgi:DNA-binding response OmpR family regulator